MPNSIKKLEEAFKEGKYDQLLKDIYVDEAVIEYQQERYIKALESFEKIYGEKEVEIYSAPGRSEVGGNHTDHQFGKVLATSINLDAIAIVAKRDDDVIDLKSEGYERIIVSLSSFDPAKAEKGTSQALIQGVASKLKEEGYKIGGFEAYVTSDVLNGAGMSSSAAFEVLIGNILSGLYNDMKIDPVFLAQAGQYAENVYFGKPCGLMDQMASSIGGLINIDFEDPQSPKIKKVEVDFEEYGHSLCIVDTKGSHADLTDDYAAIPYEMKKVANYFNQEALREVDKDDFYLNLPKIREILGDRAVLRAMHLFEENKRVDQQVKALEEGDFDTFKKLIKESGDSSFKYLQNVYSSHDLTNQSVSIGLAISDISLGDKGVSRVHGGGFAGTIQAFVPNDIVSMYKKNMEHVFGEGACHVLKVRPYGGMKVLYQRVVNVFTAEPMFRMDAGISRRFLRDRLNVCLALNDIFHSAKTSSYSTMANRSLHYSFYNDRSFVQLSISFSLNNLKKPFKSRSGIETEKERIKGLLSKEIAGMLGLSVHTVNTHRQRILAKLNVNTVSYTHLTLPTT